MNKNWLHQAVRTINYFGTRLRDDYVPSFSAHTAFFIIISFFPFTMFLLTMLKYLPFSETHLLTAINNNLPASISSLLVGIVNEVYQDTSGAFISITLLTTLWSASKGFYAITRGMNSIYGIRETRNFFHLSLLSIFYTILFAVLLIATMGILVFGNIIFKACAAHFPWFQHSQGLVKLVKLVLPPIILTIFFLFLFRVIPNRKSTIRQEFPGAFFSAIGWIVFSHLFSFYIDNMGNFSNTYGSLTAIILFMLWLYICICILFTGAEINVTLKAYHEAGDNVKTLIQQYDETIQKKYGDSRTKRS